jgi:hypothetical protein
LLEVADSRFQDGLLTEAKSAGKVSKHYNIPDHAHNNRPERLNRLLAPFRERGLFPEYPFGTDLTKEEIVIKKALEELKQIFERKKFQFPRLAKIRKTIAVPQDAHLYLERMDLDNPRSIKGRLLRRALVYALATIEAI